MLLLSMDESTISSVAASTISQIASNVLEPIAAAAHQETKRVPLTGAHLKIKDSMLYENNAPSPLYCQNLTS